MVEDGKSEHGQAVTGNIRVFTVFLVVACIGLSTEVFLLVRKTQNLQEQLARAIEDAQTIQPGVAFKPFTVVDQSGVSTWIEFGEGQPETLLLAFSTECAACEEVFPLWNEVVPVNIADVLRVIPIHLGPQDALPKGESYALPVPAFSVSAADLEHFHKITRIPATLLLNEEGVVEHAWSGIPGPGEANRLREVLAAYARTHG